jgi:hypothetical protein
MLDFFFKRIYVVFCYVAAHFELNATGGVVHCENLVDIRKAIPNISIGVIDFIHTGEYRKFARKIFFANFSQIARFCA